jgi:hypothetical protein
MLETFFQNLTISEITFKLLFVVTYFWGLKKIDKLIDKIDSLISFQEIR